MITFFERHPKVVKQGSIEWVVIDVLSQRAMPKGFFWANAIKGSQEGDPLIVEGISTVLFHGIFRCIPLAHLGQPNKMEWVRIFEAYFVESEFSTPTWKTELELEDGIIVNYENYRTHCGYLGIEALPLTAYLLTKIKSRLRLRFAGIKRDHEPNERTQSIT